jgi:hypothetical protein
MKKRRATKPSPRSTKKTVKAANLRDLASKKNPVAGAAINREDDKK